MSVDLQPGAEIRADITRLPFRDGSFDLIICSHVMEHIDDEAAALHNLRRVLAPGGRTIVMVPVDDTRATTYEDARIVSPDDRTVAYWQHDHVRLYGRDISQRLAAGGFDVSPFRTEDLYDAAVIDRHQLSATEQIFVLSEA